MTRNGIEAREGRDAEQARSRSDESPVAATSGDAPSTKGNNSPNPTPSVTEELKPCPFCGGDASLFRGNTHAWVICDTPGCGCEQTHDTRDQAIAAWNTRPDLAMKSSAPQHTGLTADDCFYEGRFFVATVSEDGREIGLDHPTDADWNAVRQAHIALRDRLNERLAQEDMCPYKDRAVDTGLTDVERLLREARSYVEQAGLRHHDVSGLLAEIDAVLLVSNRSGVERRQWGADEPSPRPLACYDCGLLYGSDAWVEAVVPHDVWNEHLSPRGNGGGILCINCMAARAAAKGLRDIPCELSAGPFVARTALDTPTINEKEG